MDDNFNFLFVFNTQNEIFFFPFEDKYYFEIIKKKYPLGHSHFQCQI